MGEYSEKTRKQLFENYKAGWKKPLLMDKKTAGLLEEMATYQGYYAQKRTPEITKILNELKKHPEQKPSEYLRKNCRKLVEFCAKKENQEEFYYIIDKYNQFQYSAGVSRRSVRSKEYGPSRQYIFPILNDFLMFGIYGCDLSDFLLNQLPEELLDFKTRGEYGKRAIRYLDDRIAAHLDMGDKKLQQTITDILFSENNTAIVTTEMIRGIIKSSNKEMHKLLGDFLLAARLQEGVRQVVCENMDCGTTAAFLTLFDVICDHNLTRFSAVKRAVATWTGLFNEDSVDRITEKVVALMKEAIHDRARSLELMGSNDSIEIMLGLWSLGFYEVNDAIQVMQGYLKDGTRNQKLTMAYYNLELYYRDFSSMVSRQVIETAGQDYELIAAFIPTYLGDVDSAVTRTLVRNKSGWNQIADSYAAIPVTDYFNSTEEARRHFVILKDLLAGMGKKKLEYSPFIFPWYSASLSKNQLVKRICLIAYLLGEPEAMDYAAGLLSQIDPSEGYSSRRNYLEMLLHDPQTPTQEELLLAAIADKESYTRRTAFQMVEKRQLGEQQYRQLEEMLKFKNEEIRRNAITLLTKQSGEALVDSAKRLLEAGKEEIRTGGLDLILQVKKESSGTESCKQLVKLAKDLTEATPKEKILQEEISGAGQAEAVVQEKGYGLYDPDKVLAVPKMEWDEKLLKDYLRPTEKEVKEMFDQLTAWIEKHKNLEYKNSFGDECLLGNGLRPITNDLAIPYEDRYPFKELWIEFYEKEIRDYRRLLWLRLAVANDSADLRQQEVYDRHQKEIFGPVLYQNPISVKVSGIIYNIRNTYECIFNILEAIYQDASVARSLGKAAALYVIQKLPKEACWYERKVEQRFHSSNTKIAFVNNFKIGRLIMPVRSWSNDEEFKERFYLFYQLDRKMDYLHELERSRGQNTYLSILDYLKAYQLGMLEEDMVYQAIFESLGLANAFNDLSVFFKEKLYPAQERKLEPYGEGLKETALYLYPRLVDKILDVELRRGDLPTIFSDQIHAIPRVYSVNRLVEILTALGKDRLDRVSGYYRSNTGKSSCLSHLLQVCYPLPEDTAAEFKTLIKGKGITTQRLIETAMYAPQWLDFMEEYLSLPGFKCGCYYFMAHMNERFDERRMAMIAKYTPLSAGELNDGAFDVAWFKEAYETLGEEHFYKLYDAAKYISDGNKHSRARKYADAALGKVTAAGLQTEIAAKRNKDLLMSYGLVPLAGSQDLLKRYEYLQQFLKESRKFGAQRRASEASAVDMGMKNLATNAGYQDVMRLKLSMETEFVKAYAHFFEWKAVGDVEIKVEVDGAGRSEILCQKQGKMLKSLPAALKKDEYVTEIKEFHKKLKDQYSRAVKMFEQAMEDREIFTYGELVNLMENPVVRPVVTKLVYIGAGDGKGTMGFLSSDGLIQPSGKVLPLSAEAGICVAHPVDLYSQGHWSEYQQYLFTPDADGNRMKQPFKQVFRELYVKLPEELDKYRSLMFAGNQIQPQKTVGCLKGRRWIADYEEGLQKVYYKENIVARIYCLADWFSPADVEAPTLEWVEFSDRKTFKSMAVKEVPDIVYSEVMRDVDLAVSVAHAGGVDPETSHSTVEMRRAIVEFNLPLFGLTNVKLEGSHAMIDGRRGQYSIHLGSGVIHQLGGPQIQVLPVHSQQRGKLFLPFMDEDPKTAEIMSKVVLFARDEKIKDPYILSQIG